MKIQKVIKNNNLFTLLDLKKSYMIKISDSLSIENDWQNIINFEIKKSYFQNLISFLDIEYRNKTCFPQKNKIFESFKKSSFKDTKVIILGQDPYHGINQANGLAFSVNNQIKIPPSLKNIYKELALEYEMYNIQQTGNLSRWAEQGVLLLNSILTVEEKKPGSHQNKGWETFTDHIISYLNEEKENLVFLLWGGYAQKKGKKINSEKHLVLTAHHPSPLSANRGGWFGNNHFTKANDYLSKHSKNTIEW